jgi:GNAT superfamily N-acetyltransferase
MLQLLDESAISPATDAAIRAGLAACFSSHYSDPAHPRSYHSRPAYSVLHWEGPAVIAHAAVVVRTIDAGGVPLRIAGIQSLFVRPEHRGCGLTGPVLTAAMGEAARRGLEAGLLFCLPRLERLYARYGWRRMLSPRPVWATDDAGKNRLLPDRNILMFYPLSRARFPDGPIHLNGNDW